jgi:hypothetical protein
VTDYLAAWDAAAELGFVPASATLTPRSVPHLPDAGLWAEFYPPGQTGDPPPGAEYAMAHPDGEDDIPTETVTMPLPPVPDDGPPDPFLQNQNPGLAERVAAYERERAEHAVEWAAQLRREAIAAPGVGATRLLAWVRDHRDGLDDDTRGEISTAIQQALGLLAQAQQIVDREDGL